MKVRANLSRRRLGPALAGLAAGALLSVSPALADVTVGIVASVTGPAAALGGETRKAVDLMPTEIDGEKVHYILLDDATDPTHAVQNARKLISEEKVDVILGPNLISTAMAIADIAHDEQVPMVSVAPLDVSGDKRSTVFRSEPSALLMVRRIVQDMEAKGLKRVAFIGFADSWGELLLKSLTAEGKDKIEIVATERFGRSDPSVQAQVLKVMASKPDAVFVGGSGTPAAMPQITLRQRGYKGTIYQSHGVTSKEFLRVGGRDVEGALLPVGPVLVAEQLPDSHPNKANAVAFVKAFEEKFGAGSRSTFAGASWDSFQIAKAGIESALKAGVKPGTPEFRLAVRDGIQSINGLVGVNGVYTITAQDHAGYDPASVVLITVKDGAWSLVQ
jgi:branched-chain amino acid transport system substrate-binding protein